MTDRTTIETVAEALAGVTITDPDFEGLEREDWRRLAAAALKAIRAVTAEAPEGADLAYLSDRARAYVVGLEARLKTLRQENDDLRAKLADPRQRDEKAIRGAYERGWSACAEKLASRTQDAIRSLTHCHSAALANYMSTPEVVRESYDEAHTRQAPSNTYRTGDPHDRNVLQGCQARRNRLSHWHRPLVAPSR